MSKIFGIGMTFVFRVQFSSPRFNFCEIFYFSNFVLRTIKMTQHIFFQLILPALKLPIGHNIDPHIASSAHNQINLPTEMLSTVVLGLRISQIFGERLQTCHRSSRKHPDRSADAQRQSRSCTPSCPVNIHR